jgi:regulator of CtrA degradation
MAGMGPVWHRCGMDETRAALTPKLIDSLYVEAMLLADEARTYFDHGGRAERLALDPLVRVGFSCESLKVTTRLMHVIAWLLTQRALGAGELTSAQARSPERGLGDAVESDEDVLEKLPESALALIRSSRDLYERVRRLAEGGSTQDGVPQSPARSLLNRLERSF